MLTNVKTLGEFLAAGRAKTLVSTLEAPDISFAGVQIDDGHLWIGQGLHLPVMSGITSSQVFGLARADRYPPICAAGLGPVVGEVADAIFVPATRNYYHFMTYDLPHLLLLKASREPRISLVMHQPFLPSIDDMMKRVVSTFANGREVVLSVIPVGTYTLKNVLLGTRPKTSLPPFMCRRVLMPLALQKAGLTDPIKELGPIKLFIKREKAGNGRNLTNQDELEAWCIARGYTSVNPGALSLDEQIILFSRATQIVGVEGAAMVNIMFGANAADVTMVASPAVSEEKFFSAIAKYYPYSFEIIQGHIDDDDTGGVLRKTDYALDMDHFDTTMKLKGRA